MSTYKQRFRRLVAAMIARGVPRSILMDPQFFTLWEKHGFHILKASFYSPVPVLTALNGYGRRKDQLLAGIEWREQSQRELLDVLASIAAAEGRELCRYVLDQNLPRGAYGGADMMTLYCLLRHLAPKRVIEVGAGVSTFITAYALKQNARCGGEATFTSIDPYPNPILSADAVGDRLSIALPVQDVPIEQFQTLDEGDVLFIDSTHVCKVGSDVNYLILDVLPALRRGVWIHFHDIFLPNDYPPEWIEQTYRFWNEQYLLQAFLVFNRAFSVELATNHCSHTLDYPDIFSGSEVVEPGSFWIRKTA